MSPPLVSLRDVQMHVFTWRMESEQTRPLASNGAQRSECLLGMQDPRADPRTAWVWDPR